MVSWISLLFSSSGFMPHVHCYLARPALVWTMFTTDLLIGISYVAISLILGTILWRNRVSLSLVVFCFGVFIGACGLTHFMEVLTLWHPVYWVSAAVKIVTAVASVGTALYLYRLRPIILRVIHAAQVSEKRRLLLEDRTTELEQAVNEQSSELTSFFQVAPVGLVQVDPATRVLLKVNPSFCEIFGYTEAELLSMTIDDLTLPEERGQDRARFDALLRAAEADSIYEKRYITKDGRMLWGSVGLRLLRDANGNVQRAIAVIQDITARKDAEFALITHQINLERSELRYRTLTEALPQLVWTCSADGKCDYLSQQWLAYTGLAQSDQLGFDWVEAVIHPEDRERTLGHWLGAVAGNHAYDIEYRMRRHDGVYRWFKARGTAARDQDGKVVYWSGTCTDVEDQKLTQLELEHSRARFESIANNIPQLAWMTKPDGSVFWYNQNWYNYTGTDFLQMEGWGWRAVAHPDYEPRVSAKWIAHMASEEPWEDTFPLRGKNGEWRWFLSRAHPTRGDDGKIIYWLGTNTDITEQRQAREDLARANRAKDELILVCTHELRTPVTAMSLSAQIALRGIEKEGEGQATLARFRKMAEQNQNQLRRLNLLIDEMLEFSNINSGKLQLHLEHFDLRELLGQVVTYVRPDFVKLRTPLSLVEGGAPIPGSWDRSRLRQVLLNIFSNALKYGEGKPVEARAEVVGDEIILHCQDEGMGIAAEDQQRIFLPYERGVSTFNISGLGLGLYTASEILKAHGGSLRLRSEAKKGSTFSIHLPRTLG